MNIICTIGDINGIGFECFVKALHSKQQWFEHHAFSLVATTGIAKALVEQYNYEWLEFRNGHIKIDNNNVAIVELQNPPIVSIALGKICEDAGKLAYKSIVQATKMCLADVANTALLTLPVSKEAISLSHPTFIGHTELITEICGVKQSIMLLFCDKLRVALATTHLPIYRISRRITSKRLRELIKGFRKTLRYDFGIENPKIAALSLNPHCGDNGLFGNEEQKTIQPAIDVMQRKGIEVAGTFAADGFFASGAYEGYDGVLAMYHDQGLIPLKMLAAGGGVNFTASLPIIRTSPDHGTAYEIAGKNIANPQSMADAISAAITIHKNRNLFSR
ncbi:MAG: 4-hydroxythreonine-4-phosphate dehydrogenase PdxA [Ignavibacteria bacterium]|jgi:4-hydroxythreonine-4-phosphate dehydrogenase|nr:4-hydroxythreonine-4-phosphate dehydrogenase PdxA [Ignavibacteria bacterium]